MERTESVGEERTAPTPEVLEKPVRRRFTVEYKTRILVEFHLYVAATQKRVEDIIDGLSIPLLEIDQQLGGIDLLGGEVVDCFDGADFRSDFLTKAIGQRVGRVCGEDQNFLVREPGGEFENRGGGN